MTSTIPNKSNFKFQELTPITGVKPYVIRYWETEFSEIAPISSEKGEKIYARSDVEAILRIKKLLFEDKLTIPEAKLQLLHRLDSDDNSIGPISEISVIPVLEEALELIQKIKVKRNW